MHHSQTQQPRSDEFTGPFRRGSSSLDSTEKETPLLLLDDEGTIQYVTARATDLLEAPSSTLTGENFFVRVHPRQVKSVFNDLAEMVARDKQQATWLLRLKTGLGPWQWFKVTAENRLDLDDRAGIVLRMFERGGSG